MGGAYPVIFWVLRGCPKSKFFKLFEKLVRTLVRGQLPWCGICEGFNEEGANARDVHDETKFRTVTNFLDIPNKLVEWR
jgi:hypothetical protein